MAVAVTGTPNIQSNTASASDKTLTFASTTYGAGEVLVVMVSQNADAALPSPGVPSGGSLTWTQIGNSSGTGSNWTRSTAWWATTGAGGTYTVTQVTTRTSGNLSTRGVICRLTGASTTAPVGEFTTYNGTATDPLTSNTNLRLLLSSAGSMLFVVANDWAAQNVTCTFDSSIADTEHINAIEAGQATFIVYRSTNALGADDADVRASMDDLGGTGIWTSVFFEIQVPAAGTNAPAGNAAGTAAASSATTKISPTSNLSTATGAANAATVTIKPSAGVAGATVTANSPTVTVAPVAAAASASGQAFNATVTTGGVTNAPAGVAAATGAAGAVTAKINPTAGTAAATGQAFNATVTTSAGTNAQAGVATATAIAHAATAAIKPTATVATATGTAYQATVGEIILSLVRRSKVHAEVRVALVAVETRTTRVHGETRIPTVAAEDRVTPVRAVTRVPVEVP